MAAPVYDDQKTTPDDDELRRITGISRHDETGMDKGAHSGAAEDIARGEGLRKPLTNENEDKSTSPLSSGGLRDAEKNSSETTSNSGAGGNISAGLTGGLWKGGSSGTKGGFGGRIRSLVSSSVTGRRKFVVGGAGAGIVLLIVFGFVAIIPYELVHIEQVLLKYEAKIEQAFEKRDARQVLNKITKDSKTKIVDPTVSTDPNLAEVQKAHIPIGGNDIADSEIGKPLPLATEVNTFNLTSTVVTQDLAKAGITVVTDSSGFKGLEENGKSITNADGSLPSDLNSPVYDSIETALPEWNAGQIESYRGVMTAHADASFNVLPDKPGDNTKEDKTLVENTVEKGAQDTALTDAVSTNGQEDPNADPNQKQSGAAANDANNALSAAENLVVSETNKGVSVSQAISDAAGKYQGNVTTGAFISGIISQLCTLDKAALTASKDRVPQIMTFLIRHITTEISLADQIKSGHITSNGVNASMQMLNGDPSASPKTEASKPFSGSAAWGSAVGNKKTNDAVPIAASALPNANSGTKIIGGINKGIPGLTQVCAVENSSFGSIANVLGGVVQLAGSGSPAELAFGVIIGALGYEVTQNLVTAILTYFTPVGISGHENSAQYMNNTDAGANLSFNDYGRRIGANPVSTSTADSLTASANQSQAVADSHLPWVDRTFALSNPDSLVSHLANILPLGVSSGVSSLANYFTSIPSTLLHDFSSIFLNKKASAATTTTNPGDIYGVTQYAFQNNEIGKYDPDANEQYLYQSVGQIQCIPPKNVICAYISLPRIKMLGNPATYIDSKQGDSDSKDLMHCYVDSYAAPDGSATFEGDPNGTQRKYCADVGTYDYTAYKPNADGSPGTPAVPGDTQIALIYCEHLLDQGERDGHYVTQFGCTSLPGQIHDDAFRWRQYDLDWHTMHDYTTLTTTQ